MREVTQLNEINRNISRDSDLDFSVNSLTDIDQMEQRDREKLEEERLMSSVQTMDRSSEK